MHSFKNGGCVRLDGTLAWLQVSRHRLVSRSIYLRGSLPERLLSVNAEYSALLGRRELGEAGPRHEQKSRRFEVEHVSIKPWLEAPDQGYQTRLR